MEDGSGIVYSCCTKWTPVKSLQLRKQDLLKVVATEVGLLSSSWYLFAAGLDMDAHATRTSHFSTSASVLIKVTKTYNWELEKDSSMRQTYQKSLFVMQYGVNSATD